MDCQSDFLNNNIVGKVTVIAYRITDVMYVLGVHFPCIGVRVR